MSKRPAISPRLAELGEKQLAGTLTPAEAKELARLTNPKSAAKKEQTHYSTALGERICEHIANGDSLREACKKEGTSSGRFLDWRDRFPTLAEQYTRAREKRLEVQEEELQTLEREAAEAALDRKNGRARLEALKIRIDGIKWRLCKLMPKVYGERRAVELTGAEGAPLIPVPAPGVLERLAEMQAAADAKYRAGLPEGGGET